MIFDSFVIDVIGSYFIYQYIELFYLIAIIFYIAFAESSPKQGTLGKQFLKIKVVNKQGGRIRFMHAVGRFYVKLLLSPLLLVALMFGNKNKQDGDILDTYVIENKPRLDE